MMCCLETQQNLRRDKSWGRFSYSVATGGPVASPKDYFVNEKGEEFFRRRLRYIVARWSYSPAVFSWQFWNEVSACNDFDVANAAAWHRRMAKYLREIDPVDHIIHTNFGNLDGYPEVDGLAEMEVVSTNIYSRRDMGQTAAWGTRKMTSLYRKPFLITEYGVGHHGGWVGEDPDGVIVHNGLWGAVMNGSAGTALPWGWGAWVDAQDMYRYWKPEPQSQGRLTLKNVSDGRYSVTWRDTITNDIVLECDANAANGRLTIDTPAVIRSAAARIVRTSP